MSWFSFIISLFHHAAPIITSINITIPPLFINLTLNNISIESLGFSDVNSSEVTFRLCTRQNNNSYVLLETGYLLNQSTLMVDKPVKFITHGFISSANAVWIQNMTSEYLKKADLNVIQVDWSKPANAAYPVAARNTRSVATWVTKFIVDMHNTLGVPLLNIHLIGHSLGGHTFGFVGRFVNASLGSKVGRISGLDPAGPLFLLANTDDRLSSGDATFVDIIHVDGGKYGYLNVLGHADFYPSQGIGPQPPCITINMVNEIVGCSHMLAPAYFIESINSLGFISTQCTRYIAYLLRMCLPPKNPTAIMGDNCNTTTRGSFYLTVNSKPPYARFGEI